MASSSSSFGSGPERSQDKKEVLGTRPHSIGRGASMQCNPRTTRTTMRKNPGSGDSVSFCSSHGRSATSSIRNSKSNSKSFSLMDTHKLGVHTYGA